MKHRIILIVTFFSLGFSAISQNKQVTVTGSFSQLTFNDSVELWVMPHGAFPYSIPELRNVYVAKVNGQAFQLVVPLAENRPYQCELHVPRQRASNDLQEWIIEPGDSLIVRGNDSTVFAFEGKGAERMNLSRELRNVLWSASASESIHANRPAKVGPAIGALQQLEKSGNAWLASHRQQFSPQVSALLHYYVEGMTTGLFYPIYYQLPNDTIRQSLKDRWLPWTSQYRYQHAPQAALYSSAFTERIFQEYALRRIAEHNDYASLYDSRNLRQKYLYIKSAYTGAIREKLVTYLILSAARSNEIDYCYQDARKYIKDRDFRIALENHCQDTPGKAAYNFSLADSSKRIHRLTDYAGKVIVLDFWFTGCGNCRRLTPKLAVVEEAFKENKDVVFVSISSDTDMDEWKQSIRGGAYTTSAAEINLYTQGRGSSDPLYQKINFRGAPTLMLIGKDGKWCENPVDCRIDEGKDLTAKINEALKH